VVSVILAALALAAATPSPSIPIVGARPAERHLLGSLLAGMRPETIDRIRFTRAPGKGLTLWISSHERPAIRSYWEEDLLAGAYLDHMAHVRRVGFVRTDEGAGPVTARWPASRWRIDSIRPGALASYERRVRRAADASGARILELRALRAVPPSLVLTLQARDPAAFLKHRLGPLLRLYEHPPAGTVGVFFSLLDRSGKRVWALGRLPNEGSYWVRPDLDECDTIEHSQAVGAPPPPPCPA
jgi:hypothetical protein